MVDRPDQWLWQPVHRIWLDQIKDENPALFSVIEATRLTQDDDTAAFLCFLGVRLLAMHRVLKPTGSIYLHCDHSANGYIRMVMDAVFGKKNFRNEIVWRRATSHNDATKYGNISDSILFYSMSKNSTWKGKDVSAPKTKEQIKDAYPLRDQRGRMRSSDLTGAGTSEGESGLPWKGYQVTPRRRHWAPPKSSPYANWIEENIIQGYTKIEGTHDRLNALDKAGLITHPTRGQWPGLKRYAEADQGNYPQNIILSPSGFTNYKKGAEYTGSPDQKPLALYEIFIKASSNPRDLVLDPFAGCATTPIAAHNLGRRWVGIDRREDAAFHITNRLLGLGINVDEFKARQQFLLPELRGSCEIRYEPPVRTDTGETAAPGLAPVYAPSERSTLTHGEMKDYLIKTFGLQCWGCDFTAPDERYLQLDHVDPKADGGSNHLDNRALLCQPCNGTKGNRLTMSALRSQNIRDNHLTRPAGAKRGDDGHPIKLREARAQCREALERHRMGLPMQLGMML